MSLLSRLFSYNQLLLLQVQCESFILLSVEINEILKNKLPKSATIYGDFIIHSKK